MTHLDDLRRLMCENKIVPDRESGTPDGTVLMIFNSKHGKALVEIFPDGDFAALCPNGAGRDDLLDTANPAELMEFIRTKILVV